MLVAAVYGLIPVYAKGLGMSVAEIGNLMAILIFGGLLFQWPFGWLADRIDRRKVLISASLLTALSGATIAFLDTHSQPVLLVLSFLFGGFSFTIYPLSMAHACENLPDHQIVPATGGFVLSYSLGAIAGPLIAPFAMDAFGACGLFYFMAGISLLLAFIGLKKHAIA